MAVCHTAKVETKRQCTDMRAAWAIDVADRAASGVGLAVSRYQIGILNILQYSITMLQTSKLTSKFQATVPTAVRKALQLKAGDMVGFDISGSQVTLRRATPLDLAFTQALEGTLSEWSSEADEHAFRDLQ